MKNPWSLTTAETEVMDFFLVTGRRAGPLLRAGDRVQLLGRTWRVVDVRP